MPGVNMANMTLTAHNCPDCTREMYVDDGEAPESLVFYCDGCDAFFGGFQDGYARVLANRLTHPPIRLLE